MTDQEKNDGSRTPSGISGAPEVRPQPGAGFASQTSTTSGIGQTGSMNRPDHMGAHHDKPAGTSASGTGQMMQEAKQSAGDLASRAKEQAAGMLSQQKDSAINQVNSMAGAIRTSADQLRQQGNPQIGQYLGMAADQLESLGNQLRTKDLSALARDAENLARRSPAAFLAGSVVAGFLLARFMKSSGSHRHEHGYMDDDIDRYGNREMHRHRDWHSSRGADMMAQAAGSVPIDDLDRNRSTGLRSALDADMHAGMHADGRSPLHGKTDGNTAGSAHHGGSGHAPGHTAGGAIGGTTAYGGTSTTHDNSTASGTSGAGSSSTDSPTAGGNSHVTR